MVYILCGAPVSRPLVIIISVLGLGALLVLVELRLSPAQLEQEEPAVAIAPATTIEPVTTEPNLESPQLPLAAPVVQPESESWRIVAADDFQLALWDGRPDVADKQLLQLNRGYLEQVREGDKIQVPVPDLGRSVEVAVHQVTMSRSGNRIIEGKVEDHPLLDFAMTLSDKATFATFGTFEGIFNVRGNDTHAWIVRGKAYNHLVDPRIPDFRLPKSMRRVNEPS